MSQETESQTYPAASIAHKPNGANKQLSLDDIADTFQAVTSDITDIGKLIQQEQNEVTQFLSALKACLSPLTSPLEVSLHVLPLELGLASQIRIYPSGHLAVSFMNGHSELLDLKEARYREVMMKVLDDVMPKLEALIQQAAAGQLIKDVAPVAPVVEEPPAVEAAVPVIEPAAPLLAEPLLPSEVPAEPPLPAPVELPLPVEPAPIEEPQTDFDAAGLLAERNLGIESVVAETLGYLDLLGGEVFEQAPVSRYFDDWMVNLRQIIMSFESSEVIGADEDFMAQYNRIFGEIEEELAKRISSEADMEVSLRTLVENRYLLNKIDEGYAAQSKELVVKGKSAIENLMRSMQSIEMELAEAQQIKTSYRHPLQKMAKDQKVSELTQKLNAAKRRLAMAVGNSSVDSGKSGDIDADFEVQSQELSEKRRVAMELLSANVKELEAQIEEFKKTKTSNPIRRVAIQQQIFEAEEKLFAARKRLELAEQNSSAEMEQLRAEYERKKQAALGKMASLEKDIASKAEDNSAGVRREAARALAEAVKALEQRKLAAPMPGPPEAEPQPPQ
ncbi:MAG: hypothetical protein NWE93_12995 [Candidatus Bathyarchaeota archaeon]|nr:hypothetical protein [Candidatus Bathyarchaeota archaeon]